MKTLKQRRLEKELRKQEEKRKQMNAISAMIAMIFASFGMLVFPSVGAVIFLLAAVAVLPLAPIRHLWEKIPIKGGWFKPVALVIAFFVAFGFSPTSSTEDNDSKTAYTENVEDISPNEETKDVAVSNTAEDGTAFPLENKKTAELAQTETETEEKAEVVAKSKADTESEDQIQNTETKSDNAILDVDRFDVSAVPAYSGKAYITVNNNVPFFTEADLQKAVNSYESYSNLDSLGRCGVCIASVGKDIMPTEERGNIGQVKPTGWQTVKYNGVVDGNYLYNRCHLIGYQLTGENANEKNLITGTRYMNVDGMLPFENMVADYVKSTNDHVLYRVTPIFEGNNLVANGVLMEAESVEDNGAGLLFNVYVYNVQPGVSIDYASGMSEIDGTVIVAAEEPSTKVENTEQVQQTEQVVAETPQPVAEGNSYVLNTNTKKFHYTWCSSVDEMKPKNREDFTGSRDDVIARGFVPCKRCNP